MVVVFWDGMNDPREKKIRNGKRSGWYAVHDSEAVEQGTGPATGTEALGGMYSPA